MRNKLFSVPLCGGANADFGDNGWKPRNKNVRTKFGRSTRSLRIHKTTASTSNFSSANSSNVMNDCFDASGKRTVGNATYKMLFSGFKTVSHTLNVASVTCNFNVMRIGFFWCKIRLTTSSQSSSDMDTACPSFFPIPAAAGVGVAISS